jgi:hypothetical protein
VRYPGEGQEMVLAHRPEVDVSQQNEFTALVVSETELLGVLKMRQRIDAKPAKEIGV